jgi:type VI secretion system ImpA family protein
MIEDLLEPLPVDAPNAIPDIVEAEIDEARLSTDAGSGVWVRKAREPDWPRVRLLCAQSLKVDCKHLKLAAWYVEASTHVSGVAELSQGFLLISGLIERFWQSGLLPPSTDRDYEYRSRTIEWLDGKLNPILRTVALTDISKSGKAYSLLNYEQSLRAGFEKDLLDEQGNEIKRRKQDRIDVTKAGGITGEEWELATNLTEIPFLKSLSKQVKDCSTSLASLEKTMEQDEFFGREKAPSLAETRNTLQRISDVISPLLKKKAPPMLEDPSTRLKEVQDDVVAGATTKPSGSIESPTLSFSDLSSSNVGSWDQAQSLIKEGRTEAAIDLMTGLSAQEHGRSKFLRRLQLAEICMRGNRNPIAIAILEDLDRQIKSLNLTTWESSELIGQVWGRLCKLHRKSDPASTRATELYASLCSLDPFQALKWSQD